MGAKDDVRKEEMGVYRTALALNQMLIYFIRRRFEMHSLTFFLEKLNHKQWKKSISSGKIPSCLATLVDCCLETTVHSSNRFTMTDARD